MASLSCDRAAAFANATARQGMPVGPTAIVGDGPPPGRLRREGASAPKMAVLQARIKFQHGRPKNAPVRP